MSAKKRFTGACVRLMKRASAEGVKATNTNGKRQEARSVPVEARVCHSFSSAVVLLSLLTLCPSVPPTLYVRLHTHCLYTTHCLCFSFLSAVLLVRTAVSST